jgi:high-affinity Fe2+/Pb2+ permease
MSPPAKTALRTAAVLAAAGGIFLGAFLLTGVWALGFLAYLCWSSAAAVTIAVAALTVLGWMDRRSGRKRRHNP